jgi:copper transport protein
MGRAAFLILVLLAAGFLLGKPAGMEAHANLVRSEPAAGELVPVSPQEIVLEFSETTERAFTSVQLYDATGELVLETSPVSGDGLILSFASPPLANGTYTVVWRNVSAVDGHPRNGSFSFHVGERSLGLVEPSGAPAEGGPPKALSVFGRWITFAAHILLVGIAACTAVVLIPAIKGVDTRESLERSFGSLLSRLWWGTLAIAIAAAVLALLLQAWRSAGGFSDGIDAIDGLVSDSRFGRLWLARIAILGLMAYATLVLERGLFARLAGRQWLALLAGCLGLVATVSLGSHAAASSDEWREAGTFADFVHMVGAGIWLGGLVTLVGAATLFMRAEHAGRLLRNSVPRFSMLALASVGAIALTGAVQWYLRVGSIDDTFDSGYGQSLIAKTLLLVPMLALGAVNLFLIRPALRDAVGDAAIRLGRFLRRHVIAEAGLGALVLLATAFLTDTSPPETTSAEQPSFLMVATEEDDLRVEVTLTPGRAGANEIEISLEDTAGEDEPVRNIILRLRYLEDDFGQSDETVEEREPGVYGVANVQFGVPGNWEVLVIVQRQGVPDVTSTWEVDLAGALNPSIP